MLGQKILFLFAYFQISSCGRIIQSDNRKTYRAYFSSFAENIGNIDYRGYDCFSKGWRKIELVRNACSNTDFVVWVDSDTILKPGANISEMMETALLFTKKYLIVAGIEESNTIRVIENFPSILTTFNEFINDGTFAVSCSPEGLRFLEAWQRLTEYWQEQQGEISDQKTLQLLSNRLSVYSEGIKFDSLSFGSSSKFIEHYPGLYRMGMPRPSLKNRKNIWACPVEKKKVKTGTTMIGKIFFILLFLTTVGFFLLVITKFSWTKKQKV